MKRTIVTFLVCIVLALSAGCGGNKTAPQATPAAEQEPMAVTAFGVVRCGGSLTLSLPFEVTVAERIAREGQRLEAGAEVFGVDMPRLVLERERLALELDALRAAAEGSAVAAAQAEKDAAALRAAANTMDTDALLNILAELANAPSRAAREKREAELLQALRSLNSVGRYRDLLALTADRRRVRGNALPALLQMKEELGRAAAEAAARLQALREAGHRADAEALLAEAKTDIMEAVFAGRTVCGVGHFTPGGVFVTDTGPLLLASAPRDDGRASAPGGLLAEFGNLANMEVLVSVEEQLVPGVAVGADVQLSPLYDKGVVWLGTVSAISYRAVEADGETVVPVTVKADKLALGPGYNVVARILPER